LTWQANEFFEVDMVNLSDVENTSSPRVGED
jgi:hypothetical protein